MPILSLPSPTDAAEVTKRRPGVDGPPQDIFQRIETRKQSLGGLFLLPIVKNKKWRQRLWNENVTQVLFICLCLFIYMSICLVICLFAYMIIRLFVYSFVYLFIVCVYIFNGSWFTTCLPVYQFIYLFICFVYLLNCLFVYMFTYFLFV